jgi:hypothetical protein
MWVRGMTRAGHSGCQGGLSPVQTQRGNDSCAQIAVVRRRLGERLKSTHCALRVEASPEGREGPRMAAIGCNRGSTPLRQLAMNKHRKGRKASETPSNVRSSFRR